MKSGKCSRGFSLVELMVASAVGVTMLTVIVAMFLSSRIAYNDTETMGQIYENGRYAVSVISEELRMADFWGATRGADIVNDSNLDGIATDCTGEAAGYAYASAVWAVTATASTVAACITDAQVGSDILVLKHVANAATPVVDILSSRTYLMANTTKGVLFDGGDLPPTTTVGGDVPGGTVWEYTATLYYVSNTEPPVLNRRRLVGNTWTASEEVAMGIERLRVLAGEDSNADGVVDGYLNAADADWGNIATVRVFLLARSEQEDPYFTDVKTYHLGDITYDPTPDDSFRRFLLNTSVSLRNRPFVLAGGV